MIDADPTRWCPHCRQPTVNAPLPQLVHDVAMFSSSIDCVAGASSASGDPQGFRRKLYCTACTAIWDSIELPSEFIKHLLATREALEEARRQIAMLRLLDAKERHAEQTAAAAIRPLRLAG